MSITHIFESSGAPSQNRINEFLQAAGKGDLKAVKAFLDKHGNQYANSRYDGDGGYALGLALAYDRGDVAKELIARGASVDPPDKKGETFLMGCVRDNKPEMVKILLDAGADTTVVDFRRRTAFDLAKRFHFNDVIKVFDPSFDTTKAPSSTEVKEFVAAAGNGNVKTVGYFLQKYGSAYVNDMDESSLNAMHAAAHRGQVAVIRLLHAHGADVNRKDLAHGITPLDWSLNRDQPDSARELVRLGAAVGEETWEIVKRRKYAGLIEREIERRESRIAHAADPSVPLLAPKEQEVDALWSAAYYGNLAEIKAFLDDFGANRIHDATESGRTAIKGAVSGGQAGLIKELEKLGAVIDTDCLETAIGSGRKELAKEFIERGVPFDDKCFSAAVSEDDLDTLKLMLDRSPTADIGVYNNCATLLILSAMQGKESFVRELLDRGADINAKTLAGDTALDWATERGHHGIAQMLEAEAEYRARGNQPAVAPKPGSAKPG